MRRPRAADYYTCRPNTPEPKTIYVMNMSAETEQANPAQAPEGKYVYCIIESKEPRSFGPIGIGGRGDEVYTVHHDGLAAVEARRTPR